MDCRAVTLALEGQMSDNTAWIPVVALERKSPDVTKDPDPAESLDALIRRGLAGDSSALEGIYQKYKKSIFSLAYRYTYDTAAAEDLLQDVFVKIFTHLEDVKDTKTFSAWIYRIALNACYSYLREKRSRSQKTIPLAEIEGGMSAAAYDSHEENLRKPIDEAIQSLPGRLRSVFLLHDVQGFKHEEIAGTLGCSVGTSKSQLFKARMKLRLYLKNKRIL